MAVIGRMEARKDVPGRFEGELQKIIVQQIGEIICKGLAVQGIDIMLNR
jgi:hypothetical protein